MDCDSPDSFHPGNCIDEMNYCLLNIFKIDQTSNDNSDYDMFCDSAINFLKMTKDHYKFQNPFKRALKVIKNPKIINILLKISVYLNANVVKLKLIIGSLKIKETWPGIILFLTSNNINTVETIEGIKRIVNHRSFTCPELFNYILHNKKEAKSFMSKQGEKYLFKQLEYIKNSFVFYNLDYFKQYLGADSKFIASRAYEAFNVAFQELEISGKVIKELIFNKNRMYFKELDFEIRDKNNLIKFGGDFFMDISLRNNETLPRIFVKNDKVNNSIIEDFRYLFGNNSKNKCDCFEF